MERVEEVKGVDSWGRIRSSWGRGGLRGMGEIEAVANH